MDALERIVDELMQLGEKNFFNTILMLNAITEKTKGINQENADLRAKHGKQMQWVSVKDRLPEFNQQVLIYANGHAYTATRFNYQSTEWWSVNNTGNRQFRGATELPIVKVKAITHWMPLPPNPKEEV